MKTVWTSFITEKTILNIFNKFFVEFPISCFHERMLKTYDCWNISQILLILNDVKQGESKGEFECVKWRYSLLHCIYIKWMRYWLMFTICVNAIYTWPISGAEEFKLRYFKLCMLYT